MAPKVKKVAPKKPRARSKSVPKANHVNIPAPNGKIAKPNGRNYCPELVEIFEHAFRTTEHYHYSNPRLNPPKVTRQRIADQWGLKIKYVSEWYEERREKQKKLDKEAAAAAAAAVQQQQAAAAQAPPAQHHHQQQPIGGEDFDDDDTDNDVDVDGEAAVDREAEQEQMPENEETDDEEDDADRSRPGPPIEIATTFRPRRHSASRERPSWSCYGSTPRTSRRQRRVL